MYAIVRLIEFDRFRCIYKTNHRLKKNSHFRTFLFSLDLSKFRHSWMDRYYDNKE